MFAGVSSWAKDLNENKLSKLKDNLREGGGKIAEDAVKL